MTSIATTSRTTGKGRSLRDALGEAERQLEVCGVPSPRVDAELLAAHLLGVDRGGLWGHLDAAVPPGFDDFIALRGERIPLQHLTGLAHFRTTTLAVGPGVFLPRPETEVVVGHGLKLLASLGAARPSVVDLCAGSGAMAASVAVEAPDAQVNAVERDPGAGPWLQRNARAYGFAAHLADVDGCLPELNGRVDLVVANPPYIPENCIPRDPEVARFDPAMALYSGQDGLAHMRLVEQTAARLVRPGGWVVAEHGDLQGETVPMIFAGSGSWIDVTDGIDLAGRDRFVSARRAEY
ncbi:MAG: peptide chain release factor N(5)-glutamine methyltransferase [Actinomycetia bacterium]|nr:peptide chain release factor N(5)-glutamine methyltransferase [Actinomycetes bacterium]